jgi:hypothetical protein
MDSLKPKITCAMQTSAHDFVNFADGQTWSAATYQRVLYVPEGARISGFCVAISDAVTTTSGANTFEIGHAAGTAQSDTGMVNVTAAADPNAYAIAVNLEAAGVTSHTTAATGVVGVDFMGKPPYMTSGAAYLQSPTNTVASGNKVWSSSGEKVFPVVGTIVLGDAQTAGAFHWWVEYRFDANIVWAQADLA